MAGVEPPSYSVIIVGAGIAGLAAARELLSTFPDLLLVEASHRRGGRILQERGVLPWPVELGPEFVHGANSTLQDTLVEMGCKLTEYKWPDHWYFRDERRLKHASVKDADIEAVMDKFEAVGRQAYPAQDLSVEQWLREEGASNRMIEIADACFANDFGCSISQLGMRETILENRRWDAGETYLVLDRSLSGLVEHIGRSTNAKTLLDWPVTRIEYSRSGAVLTSHSGRKLRCRHVIITVPIAVLQREDILFRPPLPQYKRAAIQRVKMSNAIKVIVVLDRPIWPEHFFDVVCPGSFIPEFWVTQYPAAAGYSGANLCGITGFVCGKPAEEMSSMRESSIVRATLAQLDEIFGCGPPSSRERYPATNAFVRAHVADWSKQPFIGGAYTYPSLGAEIGDRDALARPVDNTLFFGGEATHPAVNPCLQAAWETGLSAARFVKEAAKTLSKL